MKTRFNTYLKDIGAVRESKDEWWLVTKAGALYIQYRDNGDFIHTKFNNPKRAKELVESATRESQRLNPFTGKFNFHYMGKFDDVDWKLRNFSEIINCLI